MQKNLKNMKIFILCDVLFQETLLQLHDDDDDDEDMNGTSFTSFAMMCSFMWKFHLHTF